MKAHFDSLYEAQWDHYYSPILFDPSALQSLDTEILFHLSPICPSRGTVSMETTSQGLPGRKGGNHLARRLLGLRHIGSRIVRWFTIQQSSSH